MQTAAEINKDILSRVGIKILDDTNKQSVVVEFYAIYWPDGTLRWLFKLNGFNPSFLAFYSQNNIRAKLGVIIVRFLALFKLTRLFHAKKILICVPKDSLLSKLLENNKCHDWSLFAGTPGLDRKIVLALLDKNRVKYYFKKPISESGHRLIKNELTSVRYLRSLDLMTLIVPEIEGIGNSILMANVSIRGVLAVSDIALPHLEGMRELYSKTKNTYTVIEYINKMEFLEKFKAIEDSSPLDKRICKNHVGKICANVIRYLQCISTQFGHDDFETCFSHGDFTPWNSFISKKKLVLIDLELGGADISYGFDLIHYITQSNIMFGNKVTYNEYENQCESILNFSIDFNREGQFRLYIMMYLIKQISDYLPKYFNQTIVHEQVFKQIEWWFGYLEYESSIND